MKREKTALEKILSVAIAITLVLTINAAVFFAKPKKAEAVDWGGVQQWASIVWQTFTDKAIFPAIVNAIKTAIITSIQQQIIDYINGGDGEAPQFITNYREFLWDETEPVIAGSLERYFDAQVGVDIDGALESLMIEAAQDHPVKPNDTLKNYVKNRFSWNAEKDGWDAVIARFSLNNNTIGLYLDATDTITGTGTDEKEKKLEEKKLSASSNEGGCQPRTDENGNVITPCYAITSEISSVIQAKYDEMTNSDNPFVVFMAPIIAAAYNRILREGISEYNEFKADSQVKINNEIDQIFGD